jgi:hypothetical protein
MNKNLEKIGALTVKIAKESNLCLNLVDGRQCLRRIKRAQKRINLLVNKELQK